MGSHIPLQRFVTSLLRRHGRNWLALLNRGPLRWSWSDWLWLPTTSDKVNQRYHREEREHPDDVRKVGTLYGRSCWCYGCHIASIKLFKERTEEQEALL